LEVTHAFAQGFPLHRRINGSIQPAGPRMTQLRPSNPSTTTDGGPLRRSLLRSQIPIRTSFGGVPQPSPQVLLRSQALEQRRQLFSTSPQSSAAATALQAMRTSAPGQQPIEAAFKAYENRLQTDLRDFRAMCSRLILQEQEEKEKWHTLCLKMMKERDTARQRVSALISERATSHLSSPSVTTASAYANEHLASKVPKRARDENSSAAQASTHELPPTRSSPVESRPIRSLRSSPIPSPPGSPSASLYNSSTAVHSSSLPSTATTSSPPPGSNATVPPTLPTPRSTLRSSPVNPLNIMTFNPPRSPNDKTCFDVFGVIDIPETRPVKRRKSIDSSSSNNKKTTEDGETIKGSNCHPSRDVKVKSDAEVSAPRPFLIAHTDIMYIPMKGRLSCRACL